MARNGTRAALGAGLSVLLALGGGLGTARATPPSGMTGTTLARWSADGRDYHLREVTLQPGGSTGWHYHDGMIHGLVAAGTLTHHGPDCAVDGVYGTGELIEEPSGADYVHLGRNLGTEPLVLRVLYVLPAGAPLSNDAPDPGCGIG
ncbi:cupin domain-containing protein [Streptomyces sp. 4N509B]|uniref:cupin domain-containing protein n=1 Tax=Streptomyces sp. 4N509B TaxID=3457413 RepID=UPI003FD5316F